MYQALSAFELSDALCRCVTGEGTSKRKHYTDDEDFIRFYRNCIVLNGIAITAYRADLLDRAILIETEPLPVVTSEKELELEWQSAAPQILGGIFDVLSEAMKIQPDIHATQFRMADFAEWGIAISRALGYEKGKFETSYAKAIKNKYYNLIEANPFAKAVIDLVNGNDGSWSGTATDLYAVIEPQTTTDSGNAIKGMPQSVMGAGRALTRIAPALRHIGIGFEKDRSETNRTIVLTNSNKNT